MWCAKSQIMISENLFDYRLPLLCAKEKSFHVMIPSPRDITSPYDKRFLCSKKISAIFSLVYRALGWIPPPSCGLVAVAVIGLQIHKLFPSSLSSYQCSDYFPLLSSRHSRSKSNTLVLVPAWFVISLIGFLYLREHMSYVF
jgi:hypothetical protein